MDFCIIVLVDQWDRNSHPYTKLEFGKWEIVLPANADGKPAISHLQEVKVENLLLALWLD